MTTLSLEEYAPRAGWERSFAAPFPVVNGAVFHVMSLYAAQQYGMRVPREETAGGVSYALRFDKDFSFQLFVLSRGEQVTSLAMHPLVPRGWQLTGAGLERAETLLTDLWMEIERAIRFANPDYTIKLLQITPPIPRWEDGPEKVFAWQALYGAGLTDKQLAERLGIAHSTVRNYRSQTRQAKPKRGRSEVRTK